MGAPETAGRCNECIKAPEHWRRDAEIMAMFHAHNHIGNHMGDGIDSQLMALLVKKEKADPTWPDEYKIAHLWELG